MTKIKIISITSLIIGLTILAIFFSQSYILSLLGRGMIEGYYMNSPKTERSIIHNFFMGFLFLSPLVFIPLTLSVQYCLKRLNHKLARFSVSVSIVCLISVTYWCLTIFNLYPKFLLFITYPSPFNRIINFFSNWYMWGIMGSIGWVIYGNILILKSKLTKPVLKP